MEAINIVKQSNILRETTTTKIIKTNMNQHTLKNNNNSSKKQSNIIMDINIKIQPKHPYLKNNSQRFKKWNLNQITKVK